MQPFSLRNIFKTVKQCGNSAAVKANRLGDLSWEWQRILRDFCFWSAPRRSSQCEKPFIISPSLPSPFPYLCTLSSAFPIPSAHKCFRHCASQLRKPNGKYHTNIMLAWYKNKLYRWASNSGDTRGFITHVLHFKSPCFASHWCKWWFFSHLDDFAASNQCAF